MLEPVNVPVPDMVPLMLKVWPAPMLSILPSGIVRLLMRKLEGKMATEIEVSAIIISLPLIGTVLQPQFAGIVQSELVLLTQLLETDIVITFDVAGLPVVHVAFEVNTTLIASDAANVTVA